MIITAVVMIHNTLVCIEYKMDLHFHFIDCFLVNESVFVTVDPDTWKPQLDIVPNMKTFWQFASTHDNKDPNTPRLGRLQDVREFVKFLECTIMEPVKRKEIMVKCCIYIYLCL